MAWKHSNRIWIVAAIVVLGYLPAGFYPFVPVPAHVNGATRQSPAPIHFPEAGIATTPASPAWLRNVIAGSQLTLEIAATPANTLQKNAYLFCICESVSRRNLLIGQHEDKLMVQVRHSPNSSGIRRIYLPRAFAEGKESRIQVSIGTKSLAISLNGNPVVEEQLDFNPFPAWDSGHRVAIGNALEFNRPWFGLISQISVAWNAAVFDVLADEDVTVDHPYRYLRANRLHDLFDPHWDYVSGPIVRDWIMNVVGFIPLGCLLVGLFDRRGIVVIATLACAALSLTIEAVQILLPWRVPAIGDFLLNTLGSFIGAIVTSQVLRLRRARSAN